MCNNDERKKLSKEEHEEYVLLKVIVIAICVGLVGGYLLSYIF